MPDSTHNISMNIIIFSKDRACQLDLLLNSMQKMFREYEKCSIILIYTFSNEHYKHGYSILEKSHKNVNFTHENSFKDDLVNNIDADKKHTMFLVDDIVWKERFSIDCKAVEIMDNDPDILCLSLRLNPRLTYCYTLNIEMGTPQFDGNLCWHWDGAEGDFGYPMSLDGHIFRTEDILPLLTGLQYFNPNTLEGRLSENPIKKGKMICLNRAPIFNMPINKVQTYNTNRHGKISAEHLNRMFLAGYRISLPPLIGFDNKACHQEVDINLRRSPLNFIKNSLRL